MRKQFLEQGYAVFQPPRLRQMVDDLRSVFEADFYSRFNEDVLRNRNLLKRFANTVDAMKIFTSVEVADFLSKLGIEKPVFCGPLVSHYTANDHTGGGYGLPFHQDFPSMMSASNSVILWISLADASKDTHGLQVVPGGHRDGLQPGVQEAGGYVLTEQDPDTAEVVEVERGAVLAMHPWLPHRTYVNPKHEGWKLSLSQRFDDLECSAWAKRNYQSAYGTSVDRDLFRQEFL